MSKIDQDSVVWITGASSGIGEALTNEISNTGAKIIISSRRSSELERVKGNCRFPENISILPVDLADSISLEDKAKEAISLFGKIDVLINNGGISQRDTIINTSIKVDRKLMEVNYFGTITLSKAVLPQMIERKSGHFVIISSVTGIISAPLRSSYAASKHALHGYFDALRAEHHLDNIKVSIICPGYIRTNISINALTGNGNKQNIMDQAQENGMLPEVCAQKILKAIIKNKEEVYFGGLKEVGGIYLKRFWPKMYSRIINKIAVK